MAPATKGRGKFTQPFKRDVRQEKRKQQVAGIESLEKAVDEFDPKTAAPKSFTDLPLCEPTQKGLKNAHFTTLTDIQSRAIPLALKGNDILGAAKTGSGKTLAFVVPVLERLHRARWTEFDGLGALILAPTRELAAQIFGVLRKVGKAHPFSAGLVTGGKSLKDEAERLAKMNILVCTPGRMLQHLDQTAGFDVDNLQILVLDEADRIMDMGFQSAVDALVDHLPVSRQTLLFSATQSKKVSDLARLSLKDPEYVSVHEDSTPQTLQQHYIVAPLAEKLDTLYGFIKANTKSKMIVFFSSGKQVRFVYESFRQLQPGIPLLHLLGKQKQLQRMGITRRFAESNHACLFATDVVARGVDFPAVDWVVQVDCPEDAETYIHRVGRTARYERDGKAVLFLDPSEEAGMLSRLEQKKVPIQKINVKESKKRPVKQLLQNTCFKFPEVKYLGQKAFISYARSIYLQKDREVFDLEKLDLDAYAESMGLPGTPQIKFQKGEDAKRVKNAPRRGAASSDDSSDDDDDAEEGGKKQNKKKKETRTKYDRMFERTNQDVLSGHYSKLIGDGTTSTQADAGSGKKNKKADEEGGQSEAEEDDFLTVKRVLDANGEEMSRKPIPAQGYSAHSAHHHENGNGTGAKTIKYGAQEFIVDSKRREKALLSKKKMLKYKDKGTKLIFDDDGTAHAPYELRGEDDFARDGPADEQRAKFVTGEVERVKEADLDDRERAREIRREKRLKRKAREAEERGDMARAGREVEVGNVNGEDPLALLRSLPMSTGKSHRDDDEEGGDRRSRRGQSDEDAEEERPRKKARKWFQTDDSSEDETRKKGKSGRKVLEIDHEPETLEDLEALAAGLLE